MRGFLSVISDVTERKRLENEIRRTNAELEERVRQRTAELATANQELETFSYSVSHDLKAPLRGIDGYSQLLLTDYGDRLDEEGRFFLNNVRQGIAQMNQLIEDLLAYSRMERRSLDPVAVNLEQEVGKVLAERKSDIEARQDAGRGGGARTHRPCRPGWPGPGAAQPDRQRSQIHPRPATTAVTNSVVTLLINQLFYPSRTTASASTCASTTESSKSSNACNGPRITPAPG